MQKKQIKIIIGIALLTLVAAAFCFPQYANFAIDALNSKTGLKIARLSEKQFKMGLDVKGGVRLEYQADLSSVQENLRVSVMEGARDLIERRINVYGVAEPLVQSYGTNRLIVELPGVESIDKAISWIGATPWLQFSEQRSPEETQKIIDKIKEAEGKTPEELAKISDLQLARENPFFKDTLLSGKYLKKATLKFNQTTGAPEVGLEFDPEGAKIFGEVTERNVGKSMAIYLDGQSIIDVNGDGKIDGTDIYAPRINEKISDGSAIIIGISSVSEAKILVSRLNEGALPVPLGQPIRQEKIGPTLGAVSFEQTVRAGIFGFLLVAVFMVFFYRLPGLLASLALVIYVIMLLSIFKLIGVTMSLAAIGGFILSVGMAVDANVLIFSRMREELDAGKSFIASVEEGFSRAWPAIRDGNLTTIAVVAILFLLGTSFVKGFAITLFWGIAFSMFSAIVVTRSFLRAFAGSKIEKIKWLWRPIA